ncbi:TetR/AcrR family transcriptional regulator [Isoptericola jiangsuensis]|uniref:TetR/AcrR family transcriptional regulator n=1 Tax=Isoptericola jiangsuensis TaxID=548579 RepID=UPI00386B06F5
MASKRDEDMLRALAVALVAQPRATLVELAQLIGVSKATLYRFCPTREEMLKRVMGHTLDLHVQITKECVASPLPPQEAFRQMVTRQIEEREFTSFASYYWNEMQGCPYATTVGWEECQEELDAFFLRGQREGVFRLDVPTAVFGDYFNYGLASLIEAERRGRLARQSLLDTAMKLLLQGMAEPTSAA